MKRVRCPKCDNYIIFDETKYEEGQQLVFQCTECSKQFGIRIGVSKLHNRQKDENPDEQANEKGCGSIVVIENCFHYKQVIPLKMGDNVIGRYQKGNRINTPFETVDPSVDLTHCAITVSRNKKGRLQYVLRDLNSNTGTFVDNVELKQGERRNIEDGCLFTLGATSIILRSADSAEE
ncbi:MAG: FHA domain-containing protein [Prevotella sp.]|nr:FHA domain-containing protein [Prevotella sp.]